MSEISTQVVGLYEVDPTESGHLSNISENDNINTLKNRIEELERENALLKSSTSLVEQPIVGKGSWSSSKEKNSTNKMTILPEEEEDQKPAEFDFDFEASLPQSWRGLLNREGQLVWHLKNTLLGRIFGVDAARKFQQLIWSNFTRSQIVMGLIVNIPLILFVLGLFKIVPEFVFIVSCYLIIFWFVTVLCSMFDLTIMFKVCLTFESIVAVGFAVCMGICLLILFSWDYRSIHSFGVFIMSTLIFSSQEALSYRARRYLAVSSDFGILSIFVLFLVVMNLDLVPDVDIGIPLFYLNINDKPPIAISALGTFTQSATVIAVILYRHLIFFGQRYFSPNQRMRISSAKIYLECVDDPEAKEVERLHSFSFLDGKFESDSPMFVMNKLGSSIRSLRGRNSAST